MTVGNPYRTRKERIPASRPRKLTLWAILVVAGAVFFTGCGGPTGTTDPEAKLRLERLQELYLRYTNEHKGKAPPNENAFKEYIKKVPKPEREAIKVPDDVDSLFVSPRDGQKYTFRYGVRLHTGGETEALAWETTGQNGNRFVLLNIGQVQEYTDADFSELKKK